jgi:hypothetical protein
MGSDMTAHIEYKPHTPFSEQGYKHFAKVHINREYRLFALICGYRYSEDEVYGLEPLYDFRGIPIDASDSVKDQAKDYGSLTGSWLNLAEVKNVQEWHENWFVTDTNRGIIDNYWILKAIIRVMEFFEEDYPNSTRLVFWFD